MRIGDLSAATGASARSLRYYEEQGLLVSERSGGGGHRTYPEVAIERVGLIKSLLAAGLTTATIKDVLPCVADESIRTPWLAGRLGDELKRVEEQITDLNRTRDILAGLVERYDTGPASRAAA
ncbi:MerR family transcriptional regulator [Actinoplanes sp. NPDC051861]|uniref:MerR family transcriptional regulator n=1 Tax=Actinoplanes sp. NPDC051861 TaxID=3155170 RepID=UPI0034223F64